jgi:hypothetical protein
MTLNPRKSPFLFSLLFAWGAVLIASVFPIWMEPSKHPNDPTGQDLWSAIRIIGLLQGVLENTDEGSVTVAFLRPSLHELYVHVFRKRLK